MKRMFSQLPGPRTGLLLALLLQSSVGARGQQAAVRQPLLLKITPQYLILSGFWLEVERGAGRRAGQSFTFTPQLYAGAAGHPDAETVPTSYFPTTSEPKRTVRGAGLQVLYRRYLKPGQTAYPAGLYASYGAGFQHFALSYDGPGWQIVADPNGLPYIEYRTSHHTETINRYGATAQLGYQAPLAAGRVFLDLYAGLGWRTGQSRSEVGPTGSQYRAGPSDYGHVGWYFPAGIKIGVALR